MQGPGRTVIGPASQLNLSGNDIKYLYRRLDSSGTNDWSGIGAIYIVNGEFNNLAGALFQARGGADFRWNGGTAVFNNAGTFLKTGTNATGFFSVQFNNSGTANLTEGTLSLGGGGTNSAIFRIEANATLALGSGTYSLLPGSTFLGDGQVELQSNARLALGTDVNFGTLDLVSRDSASVIGNFKLSNSPGGTFLFAGSSTIAGSVEIGGALTLGQANITLQINGTLTLAASGTLNNPGTVRVGSFLNNGGTVNGNTPIILGGAALQAVRITQIELIDRSRVSVQHLPSFEAPAVLSWSTEPRRNFAIQISHDLVHWHPHLAAVLETSPGFYQSYVTVLVHQPCYFRLQW